LLEAACQQAVSVLNQRQQTLQGEISTARQHVEYDRQTLSQAQTAWQGASNPNSRSTAQAVVNAAHRDLDAAQDHLGQLASQLDDVTLRLTMLKSEGSGTAPASAAKPQTPPPPASSTDTYETLAVIVAWLKRNWVAVAIGGLALLFLLSRFVKD
jgi:hypothetical protein